MVLGTQRRKVMFSCRFPTSRVRDFLRFFIEFVQVPGSSLDLDLQNGKRPDMHEILSESFQSVFALFKYSSIFSSILFFQFSKASFILTSIFLQLLQLFHLNFFTN